MRELNVNEIEQVNGGFVVNPLTIALGVRLARMAAPYVKTALQAAGTTAAGIIGYNNGMADQ